VKKNVVQKFMRTIVAASFLVVAGSIFYFYVIFLPRLNRETLKMQHELAETRLVQDKAFFLEMFEHKRKILNTCLDDAYADYKLELQNSCYNLGESKECVLPNDILSSSNVKYQSAKDRCYERFPLDLPEEKLPE